MNNTPHLRVRSDSLLMLLMLTLAIPGCGQPSASGIRQTSTSFSSGNDGTPGIDSGTVNRITLLAGPTKGVTFVLWSDLSNSSGHGGTRPGTNGREAYYEGTISGQDGTEVTFRINTSDGVSGVLSLDDEDLRFNTTDGELILVSATTGKLRAAQSSFDLSKLPNASSQFPEFARTNPTISSFFLAPPSHSDPENAADLTEDSSQTSGPP